MRRKKWLWLGFAALCGLGVLAAMPSRGVDDVSWLARPLGQEPYAYGSRHGTRFYFAPPRDVKRLPGVTSISDKPYRRVVRGFLPTGQYCEAESTGLVGGLAATSVEIDDFPTPWYTRAWITLKHCIGLH
jgi:hypothetical protein